tara:strand:+ start:28054 stop:31266 length:3213 start_codon:yes stop_codon:yes gene_type:complete
VGVEDKKEIASLETVVMSPGDPKNSEEASHRVAPIGDASLAETIDSTRDPMEPDHGPLAKGSRDTGGTLRHEVEVAPTIAAGSASEMAAADSSNVSTSGLSSSTIRPGAHLGRLEIGETLGSGAFGVVVAAYDPELKRKLAVKILRPEVFDSKGGKDAQKRLLREARAMARISHPNVVTVHDIGTVDGQVYVAMEFVAGTHLRHWVTKQDRTWHEIVEIFSYAGKGLSAAHQEGLVHRDFKPDNVLVGDRGEVRVADFGLVSISSQEKEKAITSEFAVPRANSDELGITRVGAVMGTALYMAPEQHRGHEAGPSADQFAFCVALYWALYGRTPFEGSHYEELRENVLKNRLREPPVDCVRPKWLWPILVKGMATDPASRFEDMEALLLRLSFDPAKRRKPRLMVAGLVLAGAGALGAFFMTRPAAAGAVCQNAEKRLEGTWDAAAKARISSVYAQANRGASFERLQSTVDDYTNNWVSVRTRVCEATHFVGDQSDSLMDVRMSCLDQRLGYLSELMGQLRVGTQGPMLDKAVTAAMALPTLDACTQAENNSERMALPEDAAERAQVMALQAAVEKARAFAELGKPAEAAAVLQEALKTPVNFPPVQAAATNLLGKALSDLGQLPESEAMLHQSIEYATKAGNDVSVASSWLALMHLVGVEREQHQEGYEMGRMARLAMSRGKANPFRFAGVDKATAAILLREGKAAEAIELLQPLLPIYEQAEDTTELAFFLAALADAKAADARYDEAIADYRLSLAHLESVVGRDHLENVYVLNNLSVALKNSGKIAEARVALERSLAIFEATHGNVHRNTVTILVNLGNLARRDGDIEGAKSIFARAIAIGSEVLEEGHPNVTKAIMNLGIVLASEGDFEGATGKFLVVLARAKKSSEGDSLDLAMALNNVGESLALEKKFEEGLTYATEALEMKSRLYGANHPKSASTIATVGTIHAELGNVVEADAHLKRALGIFVEAAGPKHPRSIKMLRELGKLHSANGDSKQAVSYLMRAIAAREGETTIAMGEDRLLLARVLWTRSDRKGSAVQEAALETLLEALEHPEELQRAFDAWHRSR